MSDKQSQREQPEVVELKDVRPRIGLRRPVADGGLPFAPPVEMPRAPRPDGRQPPGYSQESVATGHPVTEAAEHKEQPPTVTAPYPDFQPAAPPAGLNWLKSKNQPVKQPMTWASYSSWRQSKCPSPGYRVGASLEEYDQAVHEAVGEAAELSQLLIENGPAGVFDPALRTKVADELGDCLFTFTWLNDVLGQALAGDINSSLLDHVTHKRLDDLAGLVARGDLDTLGNPGAAPPELLQGYHEWQLEMMMAALHATFRIGIFSNAFKKLRWQKVSTPKTLLAEHLFFALVSLDVIATLHGLSMEGIAHANMAKLNARFPDGWEPGGGKR